MHQPPSLSKSEYGTSLFSLQPINLSRVYKMLIDQSNEKDEFLNACSNSDRNLRLSRLQFKSVKIKFVQKSCSLSCRNVDSSVTVVSRLLAGCKRKLGSVPGRLRGFSVRRNVQSRHGIQPSSFSIHTGGYIRGHKVAGA